MRSSYQTIERRLTEWKRLYMSKGGNTTLIKSTLFNLPTYFLALFPILTCVANYMEKLFCNFFWNGLKDEPKFHPVKLK